MAIKDTQEKFLHELGDIYDAEQQFLKGQAEMLKNATNPQLKSAIQQHMTESENQAKVLEQVFTAVGQKAKAEKCAAAAGIVAEGQQVMKEAGTPEVRDCLIAGSASKVEHYEISSYRGLIVGAQMMGQQEAAQLLQQNLAQEEKTAQMLEQMTPILLQTAMQAEGLTPVASVGGPSMR